MLCGILPMPISVTPDGTPPQDQAASPKHSRLGLFEGYGVEVEYMIVDAQTGDVLPIADSFLVDDAGAPSPCIGDERVGWSNELVLHVLELKNPTPVSDLNEVVELFAPAVQEANRRLQRRHAALMPGGVHPWMEPLTETHLWPHEGSEIYQCYDEIFDCRRHGYANLQSVHFNLAFGSDGEFARLHTAIRLVLPLIPALAASSPILEGRWTGMLDARLDVYRSNSAKFPTITGLVIPEAVESEQQYRELILQPMYREIASHDPDHILQDEWLNSRGAIARFDRSAVEIRVVDTQECTTAQVAILQAIRAVLERLVSEPKQSYSRQLGVSTERLARILQSTVVQAEGAVIDDEEYLSLLGIDRGPILAAEVWRTLLADTLPKLPSAQGAALELILERGTLSSRILDFTTQQPSRHALVQLARKLMSCLAQDELFFSSQP
jgi:gamma-glutamyl:cysteine ligase YbdK (ATP-grasp superfamily)